MIRNGMSKRLAYLRQLEEEREQARQLQEQLRTYPLPIQDAILTHQHVYGVESARDMLSLAARLTSIYAKRGFAQAQVDQESLLAQGIGMQHLTIDLYQCRASNLANTDLLRHLLERFPAVIGMQRVSPVTLEYIETADPQDAGLSGFVIIATSHVSLHAWPTYEMINFDIFSCQPFDRQVAIEFVQTTMQVSEENTEFQMIHRALRSPRTTFRQQGSSSHYEERTSNATTVFDDDAKGKNIRNV